MESGYADFVKRPRQNALTQLARSSSVGVAEVPDEVYTRNISRDIYLRRFHNEGGAQRSKPH
jgi:type II secretory pathway predicted ATPase ExeA